MPNFVDRVVISSCSLGVGLNSRAACVSRKFSFAATKRPGLWCRGGTGDAPKAAHAKGTLSG